MSEEILSLQGITKKYGSLVALDNVSLSVKEGEFVSLLGPSGCGKTTMLRIIAGLCRQDSGQVFLEGKEISNLPPEKREVNTIFQSYALFPHMTVSKNIGYGLKIKGEDKKTIRQKTLEMLELVKLQGAQNKYPHELSGGQKQRVALARGLINKPKVLLLDEPLGALVLELRRYLSREIRAIQQKTGVAFVYITHDRDEAMNMSDTMVVMKNGAFIQKGTPHEIYDRPSNKFVANFIGLSNILKVTSNQKNCITLGGAEFETSFDAQKNTEFSVCIRSENVEIHKSPTDNCCIGTLVKKTFSGGFVHLECKLTDENLIAGISASKTEDMNVGDTVYIKPLGESFCLLEEDYE